MKILLQMQAAMESCPAKTALAGGMGFALGGAFGLFMSSVWARTVALPSPPGLTARS